MATWPVTGGVLEASQLHRWHEAFTCLARVELRTWRRPLLRPRRYALDGSQALRHGAGPDDVPSLVAVTVDPDRAAVYTARTAADAVVIGRFDAERTVRLRAYYGGGRRGPSTLRVQGFEPGGHGGVERSIRAAQAVARHAPGFAPRLLDHGTDERRGVAFLREECVDGTHPANREAMRSVAPLIAARLRALQSGVGITVAPLSRLSSSQLLERWDSFAADEDVTPTLHRRVRRLLERDALLEVSLGHGDPVSSNIVLPAGAVVGDRLMLIDWEHARRMPVGMDLAKLHHQSADPTTTVEELRRSAGSATPPRGTYAFTEQLAIAHALMLSWYERRRQRAAAVGRLEPLARDTRRRVALVDELLG